jgi:hypothetical protein
MEQNNEKIIASTERSRQSIEKSKVLAEQTNNIGINILSTLKEQDEKITNIQTNMNVIHNTMQKSEKTISSMESFWNSMWNKITSKDKKTDIDIILDEENEKNDLIIKKIKKENFDTNKDQTNIIKYQCDDLQNRQINDLSNNVNKLREMSIEINNQLLISNIKLDQLHNSINKGDERIKKSLYDCKKLTK